VLAAGYRGLFGAFAVLFFDDPTSTVQRIQCPVKVVTAARLFQCSTAGVGLFFTAMDFNPYFA
jgi:hypothetical protein